MTARAAELSLPHERPVPLVVSTTSPSRAVSHSLSLAGSSTHCASVVPALQLATDGNAWMVAAPAPSSAAVRASTVSLRGWQYVLFVACHGPGRRALARRCRPLPSSARKLLTSDVVIRGARRGCEVTV